MGSQLEENVAGSYLRYIGELFKIENPLYPPRFSTPGECLTHYRKLKGYSINRLAKEIRTSPQPIMEYERDERKPTIKYADRISSMFFPDRKLDEILDFYVSLRVIPEEVAEILEAVRIYFREALTPDNQKLIVLGNEAIRDLRKSMGLTQEKFGDFLGYSANAIGFLESGRIKPKGPARKILTQLAALKIENKP